MGCNCGGVKRPRKITKRPNQSNNFQLPIKSGDHKVVNKTLDQKKVNGLANKRSIRKNAINFAVRFPSKK